jgi:hypothetical protein
VQVRLHRVRDLVGRLRPDLDDALVALLVRDQAALVLALDVRDLLLVAGEDLLLRGRHDDVVLRDGHAGLGGVLEAQVLDRVEHTGDRVRAVALDELADELVHLALGERAVDEVVQVAAPALAVAHGLLQRPVDLGVEDDAARCRHDALAVPDVLDGLLQVHLPRVQRELDLVLGAEALEPLGALLLGDLPGELAELLRAVLLRAAVQLEVEVLVAVGEVVAAQHHVLGRRRQRAAARRREDVVRRQHEQPRLRLRLRRERQVDGHLVAVEVRVEGMADERVHLDRLALHEHRLEGLDAQPVQRRRAVQEHGVLGDDLLEDVPDLGDHRLHHLLRGLDVLRRLALDEAAHDERLEQLERHELGQAGLIELEVRPRHDDRAARVVDPLAEQVLAEPALLALEHVGK